MDEKWLPVPGYEDLYEVSDLGRVRSLDRTGPAPRGVGKRSHQGRILSPYPNKSGYSQVSLWSSGKIRKRYVHRLVAIAHIGPPPNGEMSEVNHLDFNRANNMVDNLHWATRKENIQYSSVKGRLYGEVSGNSRLTQAQVNRIKELGLGGKTTQKTIARMFGVSQGAVSMVLRGETWTFGEKKGVRIGVPCKRPGNLSSAKLTEDNVRYIRREGSTKSDPELAKMLGVTRSCVQHVKAGKTWKNVT